MCVHTRACLCMSVFMYVTQYMCELVCMCALVCLCACSHICMCSHIWTCTHTCVFVCAWMCKCVCVCVWCSSRVTRCWPGDYMKTLAEKPLQGPVLQCYRPTWTVQLVPSVCLIVLFWLLIFIFLIWKKLFHPYIIASSSLALVNIKTY